MKHKWRAALAAVLLVLFAVAAVYVTRGVELYRKALSDNPPAEAVARIRADEDYTALSELPSLYIDAVIAAEDHRFYQHHGIDPVSVGRALWTDLRTWKVAEGGSSITQQLVKNTFFSQQRTVERKIAEMLMTFRIERLYTKDEILELYVNTIYFGSGYYSIRAAARGYYGKEPSELTDGECTLLAGLPNAPSVYSPDVNPALARQRQAQVIAKMVRFGYLTEEEGERILSENDTDVKE